MKRKPVNEISAEVLAAYLDGNATVQESNEILNALSEDAGLRELLRISQSVDDELVVDSRECELIPMTAMAATCGEESLCSLECEKYIMCQFNVEFDAQQLLQDALQNGWQKENGTALHNVGRHLEGKGLVVTRRYKASVDDIAQALNGNDCVIVAVDGGELSGDREIEMMEDIMTGKMPDHTVVVLSIDTMNNTVTLYDPDSLNAEDTYPLEQFNDAWDDSMNYLVTVSPDRKKTYTPKPIDLSDVELSDELNELREAIAENAHEIWAVERLAQGWSFGPERNDEKKENPCMVPYSQLPESEKVFDRNMAMDTIKLLKKLGYDIIKREDTELYRILRERLRNSHQEFRCPNCDSVIYKKQVFCDVCGKLIEIDWSLYE